MVDPTQARHPDLDALADYAAGVLGQEETALLERHLAACHRCRLEAKRLARFATIDQDAELLADAGWSEARFALERAYRERVKPAVAAAAADAAPVRTPAAGSSATNPHLRWLVPVAAAAVLALVFIGFGRHDSGPGHGLPDRQAADAVRGGAVEEAVIVLRAPLGEIAAPPEAFVWETDHDFESFRLEVVTPDLNLVFAQADLDSSRFVVPDSLRALLHAGESYLWSVEGRVGLATSRMSQTAWFKIAD